jgi:hypothetical protein
MQSLGMGLVSSPNNAIPEESMVTGSEASSISDTNIKDYSQAYGLGDGMRYFRNKLL